MSRRATLIDDDDRSRPSIPIRLTKSSSRMDNPSKPFKDDDSFDFQSKVREVSRINEQHSLKSHLSSTTGTTSEKDSDDLKAESENEADEGSGEVASVDAIRDNDDDSADITSVGEAQAADADASVQSTIGETKPYSQINPSLLEGVKSDSTTDSDGSQYRASANCTSAFHQFTAEVTPDGPGLEVQLKETEQRRMEDITDQTSDDDSADKDEESEVDPPVADGNRQRETTDDQPKDKPSSRAWVVAALVFILIAAVIGAVIGGTLAAQESNGISSPTQSPATKASPSETAQCTFCNDGAVPKNLGNYTIRNNTSCLDFYNQLTGLFATDPLCPTGQALAWRYCGCSSLPPAPEHPSCTLCRNGTIPKNASAYCQDLSTLVAIVGSSRLSNCNDLRTQVLPTCSCTNSSIRRTAFRKRLLLSSGLRNFHQ